MKRLLLGLLILIVSGFGFVGCNRSDTSEIIVLDLTQQWNVDVNGNIISKPTGSLDSQWQNRSLSQRETALFQGLDTASLTGMQQLNTSSSIIFPNPSSTISHLGFVFDSSNKNPTLLKYVIVDQNYIINKTGTATVSYNQPAANVSSSLPAGLYRVYFTLSSQAAPNYFTSWGDIERQ